MVFLYHNYFCLILIMETLEDRIVVDPGVMMGKPVIKGTRITVEYILKTLSEGASVSDIINMYPHLKKEDVGAALLYASALVAHEEILPIK